MQFTFESAAQYCALLKYQKKKNIEPAERNGKIKSKSRMYLKTVPVRALSVVSNEPKPTEREKSV